MHAANDTRRLHAGGGVHSVPKQAELLLLLADQTADDTARVHADANSDGLQTVPTLDALNVGDHVQPQSNESAGVTMRALRAQSENRYVVDVQGHDKMEALRSVRRLP